MGYLVVGLEQQHGVDADGWDLWIVGLAEDRLYVLELLFLRTLVNVMNCLRADIHSINPTGARDAPSGAHGKPARSGTDVGNTFARFNAKHIHDAVDLQTLIAPRDFENGEIATVRGAGLALCRRRGGTRLGPNRRRHPKTCHQHGDRPEPFECSATRFP